MRAVNDAGTPPSLPLIDPRTSGVIGYWDMLTAFALIFTAIVTPLEVSFFRSPDYVDALFIINRMVDMIFIVDMVIQFFLMYKAPPDLRGAGLWITDHRKIAWNYLTGWFLIDLISVVVSAFDVIALASAYQARADNIKSGSSQLSRLTFFRVIRILRLVKLVRLMRASRLFSRWEARIAIDYGTMALIKCMVGVSLVGHWFACIWSLQTELAVAMGDEQALLQSWKYFNGFCAEGPGGVTCDPPGRMYAASLYWSIMTITSIGYGDVTPNTTLEYAVATVIMLLGAATWGSVIATFCGVMANRDAGLAEFRQTMDDLNRFVREQGFPEELRIRLREYFKQTKHLQLMSSHCSLLKMMSPSLQGEVALSWHERWLKRVWFFSGTETEFMVQVAINLNAMVFAPGELAAPNHLYIVHRGVALYGGRVLTAGRVWGEDMILTSEHLQTRYCARAMNYLEVYMIRRDELLSLAAHFPSSWKCIRRHAVRMALRRQFVLNARQLKEREGHGLGSSGSSAISRILSDVSSEHGSAASAALLASQQASCNFAATTPFAAGGGRRAAGARGLGRRAGRAGKLAWKSVGGNMLPPPQKSSLSLSHKPERPPVESPPACGDVSPKGVSSPRAPEPTYPNVDGETAPTMRLSGAPSQAASSSSSDALCAFGSLGRSMSSSSDALMQSSRHMQELGTIQSLQAQQAQLIAQQAEALRLLTTEVSEMRAAMVTLANSSQDASARPRSPTSHAIVQRGAASGEELPDDPRDAEYCI